MSLTELLYLNPFKTLRSLTSAVMDASMIAQ